MSPELNRILQELTPGLRELYGSRLRGLVLYGSRARGDYTEGSEVDLLALVDGPVDPMQELARTSDLTWRLGLEHTLVVSLFTVDVRDYDEGTRSFLRNARRDAVRVA